jgi:hypothetical protein
MATQVRDLHPEYSEKLVAEAMKPEAAADEVTPTEQMRPKKHDE